MLALFSKPIHINYSDAMASFSIYEEGDTDVGDVFDDCNKHADPGQDCNYSEVIGEENRQNAGDCEVSNCSSLFPFYYAHIDINSLRLLVLLLWQEEGDVLWREEGDAPLRRRGGRRDAAEMDGPRTRHRRLRGEH